jgi:hypothetical protein
MPSSSKPVTPFTFVDTITFSKKNLLKEGVPKKQYVPFIINNAISYFPDCVFLANEMNRLSELPIHMQYAFYLNTIRPKRRFAKWVKATDRSEIKDIARYFGFSEQKAADIIDLLSSDDIKMIRKMVESHDEQIRQFSGDSSP